MDIVCNCQLLVLFFNINSTTLEKGKVAETIPHTQAESLIKSVESYLSVAEAGKECEHAVGDPQSLLVE